MNRLAEIVRVKRREAEALTESKKLSALLKRAEKAEEPRGFLRALRAKPQTLIAEVKRASPSRGFLTERFDPADMAAAYERGGADAISVLTDSEFFKGSGDDLIQVRNTVRCPVLRKDFILNKAQVAESRAMGADAMLLIVRILEDEVLLSLREEAERWGMDVLVEAHDQDEVARAAALGASLIGINNRDLDTFEIDLGKSLKLRDQILPGILAVSESGVKSREDADRLYGAGFNTILVGESIIRQGDREAAVRSLRPYATTGPVR